ncbi:O-antigen ligase domain-containing protein [Pseudomonas wadenswilerensis]
MNSSKWTNNIFYAFIALPGLVFLLKERGAGLLKQPLAWAWLAFMAWFLVPAAIAGDGQFYKHILYVTLFVFVVAALVEPDLMRNAIFVRGMFWILCVYIYGFAAYAYLTGLYGVGQRVGLLPSRLENVIYASIWLLCALALAFPLWLKERRYVEAAAAVLLSIFAITFVLQTRTALVGAVFLFGLWALHAIWKFPRLGLAGLAVGIAVAGLTFWIVHDQAWFVGQMARGDSFRVELFHVMTGEWRNCGWLLGCGVEFKTTQLLAGYMPIQHPHNIFVALGLYTGGVSLVLFVVLMAATLLMAWRNRDPWGLFLAAALVMLNFDGSKLVGNPDELWPLVLLPAAVVMGWVVQEKRRSLI